MSDAVFAAGLGELAVTGVVVSEHGFAVDAQPCVPGEGSLEGRDGRVCLLIGRNGGCGDAAMVINGDVDVLEAATTHSVALANRWCGRSRW